MRPGRSQQIVEKRSYYIFTSIAADSGEEKERPHHQEEKYSVTREIIIGENRGHITK